MPFGEGKKNLQCDAIFLVCICNKKIINVLLLSSYVDFMIFSLQNIKNGSKMSRNNMKNTVFSGGFISFLLDFNGSLNRNEWFQIFLINQLGVLEQYGFVSAEC